MEVFLTQVITIKILTLIHAFISKCSINVVLSYISANKSRFDTFVLLSRFIINLHIKIYQCYDNTQLELIMLSKITTGRENFMAHYTEKQQKDILYQYQNGCNASELCKKHGIARSTLYLWIKQYSSEQVIHTPRDIYLLSKEVERLRIENSILRISRCSAVSPLCEKLEAITRLRNEFSIHSLCKVLEVRRSTYYHHSLHSPEKTLVQHQDEVLKPIISEIFEKSRHSFGARKIRAKLMELGHTISERRTLRLMKELDISPRTDYRLPNSANDREYKYYPNKLKRMFVTAAPNLVWVSDTTYVRVGSEAYYLCVVIELFSRKVISYAVSTNNDTSLVINAFREAFALRGKPQELMFHSDLGVQYTAYEFKNLLRHHQVKQSFSAPGSPHDNAVAESFFASVKKEEFKKHFYQTEAQLLTAVREYIEFYNGYRPHQSLGFKTPDQIEADFERQISQ